jgi:hypothetical protein
VGLSNLLVVLLTTAVRRGMCSLVEILGTAGWMVFGMELLQFVLVSGQTIQGLQTFLFFNTIHTANTHAIVILYPYSKKNISGMECSDPVPTHSGSEEVFNLNGRNQVGSVATYKCKSGYVLIGNSSRYLSSLRICLLVYSSSCSAAGTWTGVPPHCDLLNCWQPPAVENAAMELLNGSTTWRAMAAYHCKAGYQDTVQGSQAIKYLCACYFLSLDQSSSTGYVCQLYGKWSPVSLSCVSDLLIIVGNITRSQQSKGNEKGEINIEAIITIVVLIGLVILSLLLSSIVFSHRQSKTNTRARKMTRMNGVKILPEQGVDWRVSYCMKLKLKIIKLFSYINIAGEEVL